MAHTQRRGGCACECGNTRPLGRDGPPPPPPRNDAGRVKEGRVAGWKEGDGYTEDMLDKQVGVGGSVVCCDSLSFTAAAAARTRVYDHPGPRSDSQVQENTRSNTKLFSGCFPFSPV